MMSIWLVIAAIVSYGLSGLLPYLFPIRSVQGQRAATVAMLLGSVLGLSSLVLFLIDNQAGSALDSPWWLPWGRFTVSIDPLSAWFLTLIFVVPTLGSIYGLEYWRQTEHSANGRRLGLAYGLLAAGMALVVIARDGVVFLFAWELMALSAFFAATADDDNREVRKAGWIYLIATHIGTLCLFAMFCLWSTATGSFSLTSTQSIPLETASAIFILALIGFGFKAGLMPLHVWLPGAHANAPSHVSAVMSGVMLKMGIYGIIRLVSLLPVGPEWWGGTVLVVGVVTGLTGIACAIGQQDIKRLLAYSSIENIGIIAIGLGLALLGRYHQRPDWIILGLGGALLHVWNHGVFKPLLFFGAGAVIHATNTRNIDLLGGLAKKMPRIMGLFLIGSLAISALPPLNGFVSEWLIYLGLFHSLTPGLSGGAMSAAFAAAALAMIGALALACFAKLHSAVFLGQSRSELVHPAHDPGPAMWITMLVLAVICVILGFCSWLIIPVLELVLPAWATTTGMSGSLAQLAPSAWISWVGLGLLVGIALLWLILRILPRATRVSAVTTWDCGYEQPRSKMQYGGSSLSNTLVKLFRFALKPQSKVTAVSGAFPAQAKFQMHLPDVVLDRLVLPLFQQMGRQIPRIHFLQKGQTQIYILYVLIITIILLALAGLRGAL